MVPRYALVSYIGVLDTRESFKGALECPYSLNSLWDILFGTPCSVVNLFPREVQRVFNLFPRELIESPPKEFQEANPRPHQRPDPRPKNPRGCRPRGFLALGLAEDAAKGLPEENPEGGI